MDQILALDQKVFVFFNGLAGKSAYFDTFWFFASEYVIFLLALGTIIFILKKTKEEELMAVTAFLGVIISRAIFTPLIHFFFFRPRPFLNGSVIQLIAKDPAEASFPSGHTVVMFALAFAVFQKHRGWGTLMLIVALISGVARVVAGVHYPADILAGIIIGFLAYLIAEKLVQWWQKRVTLPFKKGRQ